MSKLLTVVFNVEDWHYDQISDLAYNPHVRATFWGNAIQDKDYFKHLCESNGITTNDNNSDQNIFYENQTTMDF